MAVSLGFFFSCSNEKKETKKRECPKDLGGGIYLVNGHRFVDLGLPSGLLWAETNIGAKTAADDGYYFAWGETATKEDYSIYSYKNAKYNSTDEKDVLDKEDDAAYVNWGSSCRMPTAEEVEELDSCTWTWCSRVTSSGSSIDGFEISSNKNNNSIFLPASGYYYWDGLFGHGSECGYWSSSGYDAENEAYCYGLSYKFTFSAFRHERYIGYCIRPVAEP